jgi:hypothetical protein
VKILKITHFAMDDPLCLRDYFDIELLNEAGEVIASFGDYYHDKGLEKAEGFILGVEFALGEVIEVESRNLADR